MPVPKEALDFLRRLGAADAGHYEATYLGHLVAVARMLESWGGGPDLAAAGAFHSIYGTEVFRTLIVDLHRRDEISALIGEYAERLAYVNGMLDRCAFDEALERGDVPYRFGSWASDEIFELGEADFLDLGRVHLADWLEQVPRTRRWLYRQDAYRRLAERLGGPALQTFTAVYAGAGEPDLSPGEL